MSPYLKVDTEGLARQAATAESLASQAGALQARLANTLHELGPCWGDDAFGQEWIEQTGEQSSQLLEAFRSLPGAFGDIADGMGGTARSFGDAEQQALDQAANLHIDPASFNGGGGVRKG